MDKSCIFFVKPFEKSCKKLHPEGKRTLNNSFGGSLGVYSLGSVDPQSVDPQSVDPQRQMGQVTVKRSGVPAFVL